MINLVTAQQGDSRKINFAANVFETLYDRTARETLFFVDHEKIHKVKLLNLEATSNSEVHLQISPMGIVVFDFLSFQTSKHVVNLLCYFLFSYGYKKVKFLTWNNIEVR